LQYHNPLVPPQALLGVLNHIGEHIQMLQTKTTLSSTLGSNDSDFVLGMDQAQALLIEHLGPVMQQLAQIQPELQKRVPPPPMPPEVQASLEIAKMDTQRKTQLDQATNALKQQEFAAKQQTEQAKFQADQAEQQYNQQMEQARQQFTQFMEQMRVQLQQQSEQSSQRIEMMKNEADNHQKQVTELLKNRDDNDTKYRIEMQKLMGDIHAQMNAPKENTQESAAPDMSPQLEKLQAVLDQMGKQQTNDALSSVMEGLKATIETLNRPKTIVRDAQGKAQGIQ
jgi:DNA repair exonuclease SbcCD ATPase subunit